MVYYLFACINGITFIALFNFAQFMAILNRISSVLYMEEFAFRKEGISAGQKDSEQIDEEQDKE